MKYYLYCSAGTYLTEYTSYKDMDWSDDSLSIMKSNLISIRWYRKLVREQEIQKRSSYHKYNYKINNVFYGKKK